MANERQNPHPNCPECGSETYVTPEEDYDNVWCTNPNCDWWTEVDK